MIECLIIAIVAVLILAIVPLSLIYKIICLVAFGASILFAYTLYQRKMKKLHDKLSFLNYEILELNNKIYDISGTSPMQNIKIKSTDEDDNE